MRVPWTARRSNQSILKENSPEYSLEGLMLKLKLQYLAHLIRGANSLEKTPMLGKIEAGRRRDEMDGRQHRLDGHEFEKLWEFLMDREVGALQSMVWQRVRHD